VAALTMTVPTGPTPATVTRNAASASDTISRLQLGANGVTLRIETTGTASNVTVSDAGLTSAGNAATPAAIAMPATGQRALHIAPSQADLGTGLVTVTSSSQTGLYYEVYSA
jgi:hypothetical protein